MVVNKYVIFSFLIITFLIGGVFFVLSNEHFVQKSKNLELSSSISSRKLIDDIFKNRGKKSDSSQEEEVVEKNPTLKEVKAVYFTSWSASKEIHIEYIINLAKETEINAVVIDVKDFSGRVAYDTDVKELEEYGAEQERIEDIKSLIERLHGAGVYVIARITVFQDPVLARARPELAVKSKSSLNGSSSDVLWRDNLGLAWIDPSTKESWDYNIALAKDALDHGFDEINFDYVRFPSDGSLEDMFFPSWDNKKAKHEVIKDFFSYLRKEIPNEKLSVDLFGLSTVSYSDLGIGQIIEDAYDNFDYVCPMIYPSHYSSGFSGYEKPAEHPYEVVEKSASVALERLKKNNNYKAKLRPWLQDFSLKTDYDAEMVRNQIQALKDVTGKDYAGYMLWNSYNVYTEEALR